MFARKISDLFLVQPPPRLLDRELLIRAWSSIVNAVIRKIIFSRNVAGFNFYLDSEFNESVSFFGAETPVTR